MEELDLSNLTFNFDKMSAKDRWDFEEVTSGKDLEEWAESYRRGEINQDNFLKQHHLREFLAFIWICARQEYPDVTFDEIIQHPLTPIWEASVDMKVSAPRLEALKSRVDDGKQPQATPQRRRKVS